VSSDDVDDSKVIDDAHVPPKILSITKDISVSSDTPIFDETHVSSDSTSDDVNEIIDFNILAVSSKSIEIPHPEYAFMVVPTESYFSESPKFLAKIQQMVSSISSFFGCLEFVSKSNVSPLLDVPYTSFSHR